MRLPIPRWGFAALIIVTVLGGASFIYDRWVGRNTLPEGLIQASGRIEGDHITVASKMPGRIARLTVGEGDTVTAEQVLVQLEDEQVRARVENAYQAVTATEAGVQAARHALQLLRSEVPLAVEAAEAGLAAARETVAKAAAVEKQAGREARRLYELANKGPVDTERGERAESSLTQATTEHSALQHAFTQAEKQLANARLGSERVEAKEDEIRALEAKLQQAKAALAEAQSVLGDLTIKAPQGGTVVTRVRDAGEVVAAGAPLVDLVDFDRLYLKVYIPEIEVGKLRLGLPALIFTDAFPDKPVPATLRHISARAEFTPKEVQTPDARVKLVYAVKLYLDGHAERRLNPGQPADAVIRWKDDAPWAIPRW